MPTLRSAKFSLSAHFFTLDHVNSAFVSSFDAIARQPSTFNKIKYFFPLFLLIFLVSSTLAINPENFAIEKKNEKVMWDRNQGKCGVCGDAYNLPSPRPHEAGGEYARGIISKFYAAGQVCMPILKQIKFVERKFYIKIFRTYSVTYSDN